jgi:hypothetical protein
MAVGMWVGLCPKAVALARWPGPQGEYSRRAQAPGILPARKDILGTWMPSITCLEGASGCCPSKRPLLWAARPLMTMMKGVRFAGLPYVKRMSGGYLCGSTGARRLQILWPPGEVVQTKGLSPGLEQASAGSSRAPSLQQGRYYSQLQGVDPDRVFGSVRSGGDNGCAVFLPLYGHCSRSTVPVLGAVPG